MKNICFVTMGNIYMVPYLRTYTDHIDGKYSIIYWDRENKDENDGKNTFYRFNKQFMPGETVKKAFGYVEYRNFVKKVLTENKFDMVVLLQTWSAILMSDVLRKYYPGKFIVDIRDYTYEKNPIIYSIEKKTFPKAYACVVSSEGYKEFLPDGNYTVVHNMRVLCKDSVEKIRTRNKHKDVLNISFIGYVNYQEQHKKLMLALKDDKRFRLSFVGTRALELESFCKENGITNVTLTDTFDSSQILDFYADTDFVNNLYGNNTPVLDYALSNKLYFSAELFMPILVCPNTYMSKVSEQFGFGFTMNVTDDNIGDKLYDYYTGLDWESLEKGCGDFVEKAKAEQQDFIDKIIKAFR